MAARWNSSRAPHGPRIYVADADNNAVKKIVVTGGCTSDCTVLTLGSGFSFPLGVAVDGSGDVYVADDGNNTVKEIVLFVPPPVPALGAAGLLLLAAAGWAAAWRRGSLANG